MISIYLDNYMHAEAAVTRHSFLLRTPRYEAGHQSWWNERTLHIG